MVRKENKALVVLIVLMILPQIYGICQTKVYHNLRNGAWLTEEEFSNFSENIGTPFVISSFELATKEDTVVYFESTSGSKAIIDQIKKTDDKLLGKEIPLQITDFLYDRDYLNYDLTKPTILVLWFIDCPPCITEIPVLNKLHTNYKNDVNLIALTFEERDRLHDFLNSTTFNFLHTANSSLINSLGDIAYPTTICLDTTQHIRWISGTIHEGKLNGISFIIENLKNNNEFNKTYFE